MKTTKHGLVGWIAVATVLAGGIAVAGPLGETSRVWLGTAVLGQTASPGTAKDNNTQAAELLRRARQLMAESNLTAAESLIAQAEALDVKYSTFYLGDTPKKARHDLERKRTAAASPVKPSQLFAPLMAGKNKQVPNADPFAGRSIKPADNTASEAVTPLPKVDATTPMRLPLAADPLSMAQQGDNDVRSFNFGTKPGIANVASDPLTAGTPAPALDATSPLRRARLALAFGDIRHADELVKQARALPMNYQPLDDTPDKVDATIRKYQELSGLDKSSEAYRRGYARSLSEQSDALIRWGELDEAERLAGRASGIPIAYGPFEAKPAELLQRIAAARRTRGPGEARSPLGQTPPAAPFSGLDFPAAGVAIAQYPVMPAAGIESDRNASPAVYDPANDPTRTMQANNQQTVARLGQRLESGLQNAPTPVRPQPSNEVVAPPEPMSAMVLFEQGEVAMKAHDTDRAYQLFRQAAADINSLDPVIAKRLQEHMQMLSAQMRTKPEGGQPSGMVDDIAAKRQLLARQVLAELAQKEQTAHTMRESDPKGALAVLEEAKAKVENAGLDQPIRDQLVRRADRAIAETKQTLEQNRPQLELADKNNQMRQDIDRTQLTRVEVREKLALKVDEFNRLMDEQRYPEAGIVAKQAAELDPKNPVVTQLEWQYKFVSRLAMQKDIASRKEQGYIDVMGAVDEASVPFPASDRQPMVFGEAKDWQKLTASRKKLGGDRTHRRTEQEIEIEKKLRTPVSLEYTNAPLGQVMEDLAKLVDVNVHLDPQGLAEEGVSSETPVNMQVRHEIMLKSALNLILQPLHLSYVIKDEVLKITSEQMRDGELVQVVYNVADLVMPIPNFVPQAMGEQAAYNAAMAMVGSNGGSGLAFGASAGAPMAVASMFKKNMSEGDTNAGVLAQTAASGHPTSSISNAMAKGAGPGGLGGGAGADYDSLIELITSTVKPTSWQAVGGPAPDPQRYETNLSLIISQTQEVHEEIQDLLDQLRRLQDLQVTIEVRFITLTENFFERIGVQFNFDIYANPAGKGVQIITSSGGTEVTGGATTTSDRSRAITVGMSSPSTFSADLDVPFTQNSFGFSQPQFGGFDATAGASLGFAVLSDIEAYFFINAAQGDSRTNVLQAPKVTLFNGQQATVMDVTQSPFVISVIPVVGEFAAAQQPVIVILSEGTALTVQAIVSPDRRFVRLSVIPFFSNIQKVNTFTFTGTTTTTSNSSRSGLNKNQQVGSGKLWNNKTDDSTTTSTGTTVQLPTFSSFNVSTTVSVPDGGTIILGGIKRLREGRSDAGVPGLDKVPYLNRLFKNTGIGRDTSSLMMMVTPRIIIQEEEEAKLGIVEEE